MTDYIECEWLAFNEGWGGMLCGDLKQMVRIWLMHDPDLEYILSCTGSKCDYHDTQDTDCCLEHVANPRRPELIKAAVDMDYWVHADDEPLEF